MPPIRLKQKLLNMKERLTSWGNRPVVTIWNPRKTVQPKPVQQISMQGTILDSVERKVVKIHDSYYLNNPEGWVTRIRNGNSHVTAHLVQCVDGTMGIWIPQKQKEEA
jgi:hypothetical protein